ncbi:MAG: methionyl-tRNA formyltransferase [Patescibacteria group bacterium]
MKIVFFGTPEFAQHFLTKLHEDEEIFVSAIVCQPDKPVGRKKEITSPATKVFALEHNIPVLQPENLKKDKNIVDDLKALDADAFVIVAYGKIIPQEILNIPKLGNINVHPSLLPKYRGPSPIQSAIANGDNESGVSIMLIDEEMDHGPILAQITIKFDKTETPESFRQKVVDIGAPLLVETIKNFDKITPQEQDHNAATFCKLLTREDGIINWLDPAEKIEAMIRGYSPWPGTSTKLDNKTLKIIRARVGVWRAKPLLPGEIKIHDHQLFVGTGTSALEILELQPEGKQKMTAQAFINGNKEINGKELG